MCPLENDQNRHDEEAMRRLFQSAGPDVTLPPAVKARLRQRLIAEIERQEAHEAHRVLGHSRKFWLLRLVPTAAIVALGAIAVWHLVGGGVPTASADFAEVLRRIREATTVAYDQIVRMPGEPETKVRVLMKRPGHVRVVWPDGKVHIVDETEHRALVLKSDGRTAVLQSIPTGPGASLALDELQKVHASAGRAIGEEKVDNRTATVYEVATARGSMRVLVDPATELPVRIQAAFKFDVSGEAVTVLENMSWNEQVSESLFSLDVPLGYSLIEAATETELIDLLRTCAELGDGAFPDRLDTVRILDLVQQAYPQGTRSPHTVGGVTLTDLDGRAKEVFKRCLRGLAFLDDARENGTWRYAGGGVRLGDRATPVCWWRPEGSDAFRVVYGDLQIKEATTEPVPAPRPPASSPASPPHSLHEQSHTGARPLR